MKDLIKDWEYNVLGIDNYKKPGKLKTYYDFIKENHKRIDGDICEVGVYRGFSILATGMLLKELKSSKTVWGFDTFEGFPEYHKNDELEKFEMLYKNGLITEEHFNEFKLNIQHKEFLSNTELNAKNISSSGDFSNNSIHELKRKIHYLGLDNIKLIKGDFKNTMSKSNEKFKNISFFASLIDCDLYEGYKVSLPFVFERLNKDGFVYLDEYYSLKFPGARIASDEFFNKIKEKPFKCEHIPGDFERWAVIKK
ncbi:MAG: hypothetical protein CBD76_03880 [Pelagibacteraceae bacterium TMED216]|nr:MAG: hypothetical protein CBD76_03880 [Pelagibacteraceae bacterium TMED216]